VRSRENGITLPLPAKIGRILQRVMQLEPNDLLLSLASSTKAASRRPRNAFPSPPLRVAADTALETALGERLILARRAS